MCVGGGECISAGVGGGYIMVTKTRQKDNKQVQLTLHSMGKGGGKGL